MASPREGDDLHAGGLRRLDACRAVLDDEAGGGRIAEGFGGEKEEVGGGLAVRDHRRREGPAGEGGQRPVTVERELDALGLGRGGDAVGAGERVEGLGDVGDRRELGAEGGVEGAAHGVERGVGDGDAVLAGDGLAGRGEGAAEEERVGLGGREVEAGAGQGLEQEAERDRLAVDEDAVAVEDDEAGRRAVEALEHRQASGAAAAGRAGRGCGPRSVRTSAGLVGSREPLAPPDVATSQLISATGVSPRQVARIVGPWTADPHRRRRRRRRHSGRNPEPRNRSRRAHDHRSPRIRGTGSSSTRFRDLATHLPSSALNASANATTASPHSRKWSPRRAPRFPVSRPSLMPICFCWTPAVAPRASPPS